MIIDVKEALASVVANIDHLELQEMFMAIIFPKWYDDRIIDFTNRFYIGSKRVEDFELYVNKVCAELEIAIAAQSDFEETIIPSTIKETLIKALEKAQDILEERGPWG